MRNLINVKDNNIFHFYLNNENEIKLGRLMKQNLGKYILVGQSCLLAVIVTICGLQSLNKQKIYEDLAKQVTFCREIHFESKVTNQSVTASNIRKITIKELNPPTVCPITNSEYELLYRLVEAEAGGESKEGKLLVANVVINRVNSPKFPNSVTGVIWQRDNGGAQFSPTSDGRINRVKVSNTTKEIVNKAVHGLDHSYGALYFVARKRARPDRLAWFDSHLQYVQTCGGHTFYK